MTVTVSPATLMDMAELAGARTRRDWGVVLELFDRGDFYAYCEGDQLIALGGLIPIGEGAAEMTFNAAPAAAPQLLGLIAAGGLTLAAAPYRAIVAYERTKAGAVFLRRLGFSPIGPSEHGEVWAYGRSIRWGSGGAVAGAAETADRGVAAPDAGAAGGAAG